MANLFDYVYWRADLSFEIDSFNVVDNLVFAEISYIDFQNTIKPYPSKEKVLLSKAIKTTFKNKNPNDMVLGLIVPKDIINLTNIVKDTKRFGNLYASNYINIIDKDIQCQFSAMCFHLPNDIICVAYRGTDDSLIGWQENLDMVCISPVAAQDKAKNYLNRIAKMFPNNKLIVLGHSKGGNLATYAAIYCDDDVKERIINVYSNDGPGFMKKFINKEKYVKVSKKIVRIIPQDSVIGMILDQFSGRTIIVKSNAKGLFQHDGFSWQVDVTDFIRVDDISENSKKLDIAISKMISNLSENERKDLAENFYNFIIEINKDTLSECHRETISLLKCLKTISKKNKKIFMELIYNFIRYKSII